MLAAEANVAFLGIDELDGDAPLCLKGFITREELKALRDSGAVAEIAGWAFHAQGRLIEGFDQCACGRGAQDHRPGEQDLRHLPALPSSDAEHEGMGGLRQQ
ncbi:sugar-binding domain-containing protein [Chelativorans intermedius]|uniref:Sugar-binding domain-containing protein n=1 Tax=Chelativorans intermedius TaxID=515947 RepID=A0ABV6D651_9HYPH